MMLPEMALLDLIYLRAGGNSPHYLGELRGQNLDHLDLGEHYNARPFRRTAPNYDVQTDSRMPWLSPKLRSTRR